MITNNSPSFLVRGASTETTRFYMGSLMSFLAKSDQTRNGLCLLEYRSQPGHEPPPHIHLDQDEAFYLLEGELEVYCMGQVAALLRTRSCEKSKDRQSGPSGRAGGKPGGTEKQPDRGSSSPSLPSPRSPR